MPWLDRLAAGALGALVASLVAGLITPVATLAAGLAQRSAVAAAPPVLPVGPLRPDGRFFVDREDRVVFLHGLFGSWKIPGVWAPPDSATDPAGFTAADADRVAALGFDAFRLAYFWEGLEPLEGSFDSAYLADIARVQQLLGARGVFSVIDSHQDMYSDVFAGDGFPGWAVDDDGIPLGYDFGFPANYFTPAVSTAFDNFWLDRGGVQEAYARQLAYVAHEFAGDPMVLGYDLLNEPWPGSEYPSCAHPEGCPAFDLALLQRAEDRFAAAVHTADPTHIAFYEPSFFFDAGVRSWLRHPPAGVGRIALSFHDECATRAVVQANAAASGVATQANAACPTTNTQVLSNALSTAHAVGGPPLETEVAAASNSDYAGLNCLLELNDRNMVGWTYGLSWRSGELRNLDPGKAAVLARAYPRAVAGVPTSYFFDVRTGDFNLAYTISPRAHGPTVIELPGPAYPNGYAVSVAGAHVSSAPGAELLTLVNDGRAGAVNISVQPAAGPVAVSRPAFAPCAAGAQSGLPAPVARISG